MSCLNITFPNEPSFGTTGPGGGEVNTASNQGGGVELFIAKSLLDLQFRSLVAGDGIIITQNADTIAIEATGGGLDYWTESEYTYNTKTGTKWTPDTVNTDQDIVLQPKGQGSILAQEPNGGTSQGNNRGNYAVDFQMSRLSAPKVASGDFSVLVGGYDNASIGNYSFTGGGYGNNNQSIYSTVPGGQNNLIDANSNWATIGGGRNHDIENANYATIAGGFNCGIDGGQGAFIGSGRNNLAEGHYSAITSGYGLIAHSYAETVVGTYNTEYTANSISSFNSGDKVFVVGNGADFFNKSNAFEVYKNGTVVINEEYSLPTTDGTIGQVITNNGDGTSSWATPSAGGSSIANGTTIGSILQWDGSDWTEDTRIRSLNSFEIRILTANDPLLIKADSATRYMSLIDDPSGITEYKVNKGGSTYQKGNAVIDNNSGLVLAELDANGSQDITIKSAPAMASSYTIYMPDAQGGVDTYLKNDGAGNLSWAAIVAGGGSLSYWTESEGTFTRTFSKFTPDTANTNQDIIFQPKGAGAIIAQQPDGTPAGGNIRADHAVDLQTIRTNSDEVASAGYATIGGGHSNKANSTFTTVGGGQDNHATDAYATIAGGDSGRASGYASFIGSGRNNTSSGYYTAIPGGIGNTAFSYAECVVGSYATNYSPSSTSAHNTNDKVFVVGIGVDNANRANALEVYKDGTTRINEEYILPNVDGNEGDVIVSDGAGTSSFGVGNNIVLVAEEEVTGSAAANIDFTSLDLTAYDEVKIIIDEMATTDATERTLQLRLNGENSSAYDVDQVADFGGVLGASGLGTNCDHMSVGLINSTSEGINGKVYIEITIPNPGQASYTKRVVSDFVKSTSGGKVIGVMESSATKYQDPIDQIFMQPSAGSFEVGTKVKVIGYKYQS